MAALEAVKDETPIAETRSAIWVDGVEYEIPRLDSLDLDEEQILYDVGHVALPDFFGVRPDSPDELKRAVELVQAARTRNPAFKRALVLIAYRRVRTELCTPGYPERDVEAMLPLIGTINGFDSELALYGKATEAAAEDAAKENPPNGNGGESSSDT